MNELMSEIYQNHNQNLYESMQSKSTELQYNKIQALKHYMQIEFESNPNYAFDFENKEHLIKDFLSDECELNLNIAFLKTHDTLEEDYQNGNLIFNKDDKNKAVLQNS